MEHDLFERAVEGFRQVINSLSLENGSNTPDYILARYLVECLANYNDIIQQREQWYKMPLQDMRDEFNKKYRGENQNDKIGT